MKLVDKNSNLKIVKIDDFENEERWVPLPGYNWKKRTLRVKKLHRVRGNCYFAVGIPKGIIDFIYRATIQLNLKEKTFIFSKGAVKKKGLSVINAVDVHHLDWDLGISIIIPRKLRYDSFLKFSIDNKEYKFRTMELLILNSLLQLKHKGKNAAWYSDMATNILAYGWKKLVTQIPVKSYILKG